MTMTGGGPTCREIRQLLGVFVVGAIEPADRDLVDEHLPQCQGCRDELASLAGLPAMLSRVPASDVARLDGNVLNLPERAEPSPDLLNSLLRRVAARRKARMWRGVVAAAAAAVIAIGGTVGVFNLTGNGSAHSDVASAANRQDGVAAVVDYSSAGGWTAMRVRVSGISPGTYCRFWVVTKSGLLEPAGSWTVTTAGYGSRWYAASSSVAPQSVHAFKITAGQKVLVTIPAT